MRIILLGSPGSGKGTQACKIITNYNIPHISTGDIFRDNIRRQTSIGIEAKRYIDKGLLVPDVLTLKIVEDRFDQPDCAAGFLLDGFPRTIVQAEALDQELMNAGKRLNTVINLEVNDDTIIKRMTGRRVCSKCAATYNLMYNKPIVDEVCDKCGGNLYIRDDDKIETVTNRLRVYKTETQPLIDFYKNKEILITVNGELDAEVVFQNICNALEQF
ncbi:MAG: adenylate kinase [Lutisporaceae bacterium]